jgi:cation transport protein ChaC
LNEKVWGAAYHIPKERAKEVRDYLDIREINGYSIEYSKFYPAKGETGVTGSIEALLFIGLPENPQFVGPEDPQALAEHIIRSRGPSGDNKEYLYLLEDSLKQLSVDSSDEHVSDLVRRAKDFESNGGRGKPTAGHSKNAEGDEQEEIEK